MSHDTVCPECGTNHSAEFIRCPSCHAFILERSPWQSEHTVLEVAIVGFIWLITWGVLAWVLNVAPDYIPGLPNIFEDWISITILGIAIIGMLSVYLKWRTVYRQIRAFDVIRRICARPDESLSEEALGDVRYHLELSKLGAYNRYIAFHRLRWLVSARLVDDQYRQGLLEALRQHSESDWDALDSSFSYAQYLVWLLPSVGFVGTVWGMSQALGEFHGALNASSVNMSFNAALSSTAQSLGTAFHTTLVGLLCVIPLLLLVTFTRRRAQSLLEQ